MTSRPNPSDGEAASTATADPAERAVLERMSRLDRWLPLWIAAAMVVGLLLGRFFPAVQTILEAGSIDGTSLPIAVGLLAMMYPVLARVRYDRLGHVTADRRLLVLSLVLNWVVGPALMFVLAWTFLPDQPEFRTGLIVVGLARCIAMVLIWNELACGDREAAAVLVAINSVFQIVAYAALGVFYLQILPGWLGWQTADAQFSTWAITKSVLIFLGLPLVAGYLTRRIGVARKGERWYDDTFLPRIGPIALYGLLFTIVVMFALQGQQITSDPGSVIQIAIPLLFYFAIMWFTAFFAARAVGLDYAKTATMAFTAAGNNFELAIAVCIGVWGVTSGQALAGTVGPLIEVPALVALVYVSLWLRRRLFRTTPTSPSPNPAGGTP